MRISKQLSARAAALLAVGALVGTSAFAESRPSNGTRSGGSGRVIARGERSAARSESPRSNGSVNRSERRSGGEGRSGSNGSGVFDRSNRGENRSGSGVFERNRTERGRTSGLERDRDRQAYRGRSNDDSRRNNGDVRDFSQRYGNGGGRNYNRQVYYYNGRIDRVHRYGNGYRVWIGGAPYPYFIPAAFWRADRFRVGLSINLGGYYNPLGYYDYYDPYYGGYYGYDSRYSTSSSRADLRGTVESVDYRRDSFVIRNDASGSFVTVQMHDRRREVQPGDYVEITGYWMRNGVFQSYDVDLLDSRDYGYRR